MHSLTYVITDNNTIVEELGNKFCDNCNLFDKEVLNKEDLETYLCMYDKERNNNCFKDFMESEGYSYNGDFYRKYNANGKYESYVIGGNWTNCLLTKDNRQVTTCLIKELSLETIDNEKTIPHIIITSKGEYFNCEAYDTNHEWKDIVKQLLEKENKDNIITIIDVHEI